MGFAIPTQIVSPVVQSSFVTVKSNTRVWVWHHRRDAGEREVLRCARREWRSRHPGGSQLCRSEGRPKGWRNAITQLNGKKVTDAGQLQMEVGEMTPGTQIALQVMRDGKTVSVPVTLESMDTADRDTKVAANNGDKPRWGIGIADLTPEAREQLRAPDDLQGAVIQRVQPGSPSDDAGLQPGQVIVGVNRHETKSASDVQKGSVQRSERTGCHGPHLGEWRQHLPRSTFF